MDLDFIADGNLGELSGEEAWEAIENFTQDQKECDNPPNIISEQEVANLKTQAKRLFENEDVLVQMQEEYTPPATYPEEVEETLGIPIEVEPLDETPLEDLGLNTCYIWMRRSLEVLRKFHWMILGGQFNQLSHVSSPLLSKPGEY
ncbi:hypothetical protein Tco_0461004 [Tanacetum coccineum]